MLSCPECRETFGAGIAQCPKDGCDLLPESLLPPIDSALQPGAMIGEYQLHKKLGSGTFGDVFAGEQPLIGKKVAIKVLRERFSSDAQVITRFIAEARAVNRIRHRNIIDIFSFGKLEGHRHYFVMELCDGLTLGELLERERRLSIAKALPILTGIASALDAAHAAGVTHRDLKPDNIFLVVEKDGSYFPKLLDFGVAKLIAEEGGSKTATGVALGTPRYMAPEQCRGRKVDHRADIYALGAVIHEMLTGRLPFDGETGLELMMMHTTDPPPRMSGVCADLDPDLDEPVLAMLAKRQNDRPSSAGAAVAALAERAHLAATGATVSSGPAVSDEAIAARSPRVSQVVTVERAVGGPSATEPSPPPGSDLVATGATVLAGRISSMDGSMGNDIHVALVADPTKKAQGLFGLTGSLLALSVRAAEVDAAPKSPTSCDELILTSAGESRVQVARICDATGKFLGHPEITSIEVPGKLRQNAAALAVADFDGDGNPDVITNVDGDPSLYIAYGLGDGRFNSLPPKGGNAADQRMSKLALPDDVMKQLAGPAIFAVGKFDANRITLRALPCLDNETYQSPVCAKVAGSCEAVVVDIDDDGFDDVVVTQQQQPGLIVLRGNDKGSSFHEATLDTQCPAHSLTVGDFDDDGIPDVAFLDQVSVASAPPAVALRVLYGSPLVAPAAPAGSARFPLGSGLAAGQFTPGSGAYQVWGVRGYTGPDMAHNKLGLVEAHDGRQMLGPFYFTADGSTQDSILIRNFLASAGGNFSVTPGKKDAHRSFALVAATRGASPAIDLWHLDGDPNQGTLGQLPIATGIACDRCVVAAIDTDGDGLDALALLDGKKLFVYPTTKTGGFGKPVSQATTHSFHSYDDSIPAKYTPRPVVADLDADGHLDLVARATNGALVVFWGHGDGTFTEAELVGAPACDPGAACSTAQSLSLVGVGTDGSREIAALGPGSAAIYKLAKGTRKLALVAHLPALAVPPPDTDFTSVAAADFDGDGVPDLAVATSSSFITVLRGVPVHE